MLLSKVSRRTSTIRGPSFEKSKNDGRALHHTSAMLRRQPPHITARGGRRPPKTAARKCPRLNQEPTLAPCPGRRCFNAFSRWRPHPRTKNRSPKRSGVAGPDNDPGSNLRGSKPSPKRTAGGRARASGTRPTTRPSRGSQRAPSGSLPCYPVPRDTGEYRTKLGTYPPRAERTGRIRTRDVVSSTVTSAPDWNASR